MMLDKKIRVENNFKKSDIMAKLGLCTEDNEALISVSADVSFSCNHFPIYKIGPDNQIVEESRLDLNSLSLKEVVDKETANLREQHERLSVRDLATKFDKNLSASAKFSEEAKLGDFASLEGHVLLKKLRDALESLRGRLDGRYKEDVDKAISMVEALAIKLTQDEGELLQEKFEVKKLANFLKQASDEAKRLVSQERSFACAEIESARAVVQRFGEALEEEENLAQKQDVKELLEEIQEARRIRFLHQPNKVMEMEHELQELRTRIREKAIFSVKLQKQLVVTKKTEENRICKYRMDGASKLGSCLRIQPRSNDAPDLTECSIQWFRVSADGTHKEIISGANKPMYAPEPLDVGKFLQADVVSSSQRISVSTTSSVELGLSSYVECLLRRPSSEFNVVISKMNGQNHISRTVHVLNVGRTRMKLSRGWMSKSRESYSLSMQLYGVRSGINSASKALFWQARKGVSFVLTFESEKERNATIILARKYALDCNLKSEFEELQRLLWYALHSSAVLQKPFDQV
ncbi:hypothetical protein V2J09_013799 [Rumex salicifolius]